MRASSSGLVIERNVPYLYEPDNDERYTNYWMLLKDENERDIGVIGMQVKTSIYTELIPDTVIESPYELSMILLYDRNLNLIWDWGCKDSDCEGQDIDNAKGIVLQTMKTE